jgi:hypothetical protein
MSPSDLPSLKIALRCSALRLAPALLFCLPPGPECLLRDLAVLQPSLFLLSEFDFFAHGIAPCLQKMRAHSGAGL